MTAGSSTPGIRVSDAERDDVAEMLRGHCLAGRLSLEELDDRLAAAYAARTEAELTELLSDLPEAASGTAVARPPWWRRPRQIGIPGVRPFVQRHDFEAPREEVFADALSHVMPGMVAAGYDVVERVDPTLLVFETNERPAWVLAACVVVFPIGLLGLMLRHTNRVVIAFDDASDGGTRVTVQGLARRPVRRAFAALSN